MRTDTGGRTVGEGKPARAGFERLTPAAQPVQAGPESIPASSPESSDRDQRIQSSLPWSPTANLEETQQGKPAFPAWLNRLGYYGLALLFVAAAVLLRWASGEVLSPAPTLIFYLAWVGAAVFGGLGPGLLATVASWLCLEFLFDSTPGRIGFDDWTAIGRLLVLLAGGLVVSAVGEKMRRVRLRERRQGRELAAANAVLQVSEEKYRFLVENSKDVTWTMDLQGRWTFISSNVEKVAGYRADEIMGKTLWDFLAPECHDLVKEKLRRRLRGEDLPPYEIWMLGKDSHRMPFEVHAVSIVDADGNIVGVQGVSRDVTERRRAEEALRESERRYRGIVQDQTELICLFAGDGTITFVNEAYCRYFGKTCDELAGHKFLPLIAAEDREFVQNQIAVLGRDNPFVTLEHRIRRPDGSITWMEWKNRALFDEQGRLTGYQAVGRDITERKQAQEALAESRQRYQGLVEAINDWAWEIDANGVYTYASPRARELLGYTPEEVVGKTPFDFMPPAEAQRVWDAFRPIWLERKPLELLENTLVRKDGRLVVVETSGMPIFAEDGSFRGYTGIDRDVTSRKWAEEQVRRSEQDLNRAQAVAHTGSWRLDVRRNELLWSHETYRIFGIPDGTPMTYETFLAAVHPEDREYVERQWAAALRGEPYDIEHRIVVAGQLKWVRERAELEFDEAGTLLGGFGTVQDITERKHAEEALRASQSMLQLVMDNVPQGVFWKDCQSTYLGCNNVFAQRAGLESAGDIVGKTDYEMPWSREQSASFREYDHKVMENDAPEYHIIEQQREADGTLAWLETNKVPLHDAQGKVIGILGTYEDITERKRAEEALRESEASLAKAQAVAHLANWELEIKTNRMRGSEEIYRLFNLEPDFFTADAFVERLHPEDRLRVVESINAAIQEGKPYSSDYRIVPRLGEVRHIHAEGEVARDEKGFPTTFFGIVQDITERKAAEEALRELNATLESKVAKRTEELEQRARQLQQLTLELTDAEERERKRLAEILHDDLQQVLAAAKFQVGLLDARVRNNADSQEIAAQAKDLLSEAIAKSRSLSHELRSPALAQSDLREAFEWLAEQMQKKHGLTVHLDMGARMELASEPLRILLYKAAQESLFNVIKHTGVREATLRLRRRRGRLRLSVSDRGQGFDPTDPGYTLGFGLLSIRERVRHLGGRIKIHSAVGKGTTFLITVPEGESSP